MFLGYQSAFSGSRCGSADTSDSVPACKGVFEPVRRRKFLD